MARKGAGTDSLPLASILLMNVPKNAFIAEPPSSPIVRLDDPLAPTQSPHPNPYRAKKSGALNLDLNGISWELMGVNGMKCLSPCSSSFFVLPHRARDTNGDTNGVQMGSE